ncbi:MAG: hypothetical protein GY696_12135 [Gammaproteobacteria bacterium]|nr:hypothetical protein [Gammaproteobacteria bacterium]
MKFPWVPKGSPPWKGPLKVQRVLGSFTFLLRDGQVWHASKIKKWTTTALGHEQVPERAEAQRQDAVPPEDNQPPAPVAQAATTKDDPLRDSRRTASLAGDQAGGGHDVYSLPVRCL